MERARKSNPQTLLTVLALAFAVAAIWAATALANDGSSSASSDPGSSQSAAEFVQSQDDPRTFTFYEKWESEAALMAHAQAPHVVRARAERVELLDGPHEVSRWNVVR